MPKRNKVENILWIFFSAGGMIAAFMLPIHIILNSLAPAIGALGSDPVSFAAISARLANPIVKLYFILLFAGVVYHGLHRVRFVLYEVGLEHYHKAIITVEHLLDAVVIGAGIYYILIAA